MDLTQLANLGEFIGGIAVLVTLLYLAVQVRSGAREQRSTAAREATREMAAVYHTVVDSEEVAEIWLKGMEGFEDLGRTDRLRFGGVLGHFFRLFEQLFFQHRDGALEAVIWEGFENSLHDIAGYPGFRSWWPTRSHWYSAPFREFVEAHLESEDRPRRYDV